jgi:phosphoserine phosphatase
MASGALPAEAQVPGTGRLQRLLELTRRLAAPFDLDDLLREVVDAAKELLEAEGGSVWQYHAEAGELELRVARGLDPVRIPADRGIVGECLRTRATINVADCQADPRFNADLDRASGYVTRCMLSLPLVGLDDALVGVLQVVNRHDGAFEADDEALAEALAAQCAVALQRAQATERLLKAEQLRQEVLVAREVQRAALPGVPPAVPGYDLAGWFQPADEVGGDTYDFVPGADGRLWLLMGDATGHGIGPALSATQVRSMLRLARRLDADLDDCFRHINDQLAADLPDDRFVTAFLGELDPATHVLRYHSGGQGPLLHFRAADGCCDFHPPTTFPLGAMPRSTVGAARELLLAPGDIFALLSDGVYEHHDAAGRLFGEAAVADLIRRHQSLPMAGLVVQLREALADFAAGTPQHDDITLVLLRRLPTAGGPAWEVACSLPRSFDALDAMFRFIDRALAGSDADARMRHAIAFAAEELFTNMVKYNPSGRGDIGFELAGDGAGVVGRLSDPDSDRFDVAASPDADVTRPAAERRPGGLGLHLTRRLVDSLEYDYSDRRSLVTFRVGRGGV